jgi:peroxiredoxin
VREVGAEIIAVSPNSPEQNVELAQKLDLSYRILSDPDMSVTDRYGIRHVGAAGGADLPYPTTFVIDASGTLRQTFVNETYRQRPDAADVLEAILDAARRDT